jgi:hypothetical protein
MRRTLAVVIALALLACGGGTDPESWRWGDASRPDVAADIEIGRAVGRTVDDGSVPTPCLDVERTLDHPGTRRRGIRDPGSNNYEMVKNGTRP